jgi:hypothetical protein
VNFYNRLTDFGIAHRIQCKESEFAKEHSPPMYRTMILCYCAVFSLFLARSAAQDYTDVQNEAGASGPSSDSVGVSSKGMIALCTIVGVVVVIGCLFPSLSRFALSSTCTDVSSSCSIFNGSFLSCQKAPVGDARDYSSFCATSRSSNQDALDSQIPEGP